MSFNIVESVQAHVSQDELKGLSASTGEPADKMRSAISTGVFAIVGSVIHRGSSPTGSTAILDSLKRPMFGGGTHLAETFLGSNKTVVTDTIAKSSGISTSSAFRVVTALLPITAGVLGREVIARRLGPDGLFELLRSQRDKLMATPGAAAVAGAVGLPAVSSLSPAPEYRAGEYVRSVPVHHAKPQTDGIKNGARGSRWWLPIAIALGALAIGGIILGRRGHEGAERASGTTPAEAPVAGSPERAEPTSTTTITGAALPSGHEGEGSVREHFTGKQLPDKLTLSDVTFDFGTADLATGEDAIDEISVQMKEHPTSTVRIEGHTDDVGDDEVNESLSRKRAVVVKKMLVDKGVDAKRVQAVGMGERAPVAPNDTEDGRAKNRRIDAIIITR